MPKRTMTMMTQGAVSAQKDAEIESLREQLSKLGDSGVVRIPVEKISPLQISRSANGSLELICQPRKYFDPEDLRLLAESIRSKGLNEPVSVRPLTDGRYGLLDGERRWRAHQILKEPLINAVVFASLADEEALEWALATDTLKAKVSPYEQTLAVVNLLSLRLSTNESGVRKILNTLNNCELGKANAKPPAEQIDTIYGVLGSLGLKLGSLVARIPLLDLPEYFQAAILEGRLSPTNALLINRAPKGLHEHLLSEAGELSKEKLKKVIADLKEKSLPPGREAEQDADMRDRIHQSYSQVRRKANWKKLEADSKLKKKLQRVESLLEELNQALSE